MTTAPTGRATNPTAYVPNAARVPISGSNVGKNSRLNTSAAAVPYRKKSYHSIVVPTKLASAMRTIRRSGSTGRERMTDDRNTAHGAGLTAQDTAHAHARVEGEHGGMPQSRVMAHRVPQALSLEP